MTYQQALDYIHSRHRPKVRIPGIDRFRILMRKLGNPQDSLRFVHIAGSSGKGSTATMCESILRHAGYKTGLYVSPFVFDFRERIQIAGRLVEEELLVSALESIIPALDEMKNEGMECTEFDVVTALAMVIFQREQCAIVVLEVGIGGLTDRTNIIKAPEVAVICTISLEHTEILGDTIAQIAAQKCGIIKPGCRVAAYCALHPEARQVVEQTCSNLGISPRIGELSAVQDVDMDACGSGFSYCGQKYRVSMAGLHQVHNAVTAISAMQEMRLAGWDIPPRAVEDGLAETSMAGRLQIVRRAPLCLVDGAHNPEKVGSLCNALDSLFPGKRLIAVMGMKASKDYEACIPMIARRSAVFIAVTPPYMGTMALDAAETARIAAQFCADVRVCKDAQEAGRLAVSLAGENDMAVACGSIYIIGDAREGFICG